MLRNERGREEIFGGLSRQNDGYQRKQDNLAATMGMKYHGWQPRFDDKAPISRKNMELHGNSKFKPVGRQVRQRDPIEVAAEQQVRVDTEKRIARS